MANMRSFAIALLLTAFSFPARAQGQFQTGNLLYSNCTTDKSDNLYYQNNSYCLAYVAGVADTLEMFRSFAKKEACIPATATQGQLKDIVVKYLRENPAKRSLPGAVVTVVALTTAFECK